MNTLYFIRLKNKNEKIFMSFIANTENININSVLNQVTNFNTNKYKIEIDVVTDTSEYPYNDLCIYLCNCIFFNERNNKWQLISLPDPNFNILNSINKNLTYKIILIGHKFDNIVKSDTNRNTLINLFKNYYYIEPEIAFYNNIEYNDIDLLHSMIPDNKNIKYSIVLSDDLGVTFFKYVSDLFNNKHNVEILIESNDDYYKITNFIDELRVKRINMYKFI